ncbi:LysR family transcriptional regulator [Actinoplanes sp. NPDC049668]|uniref:LysR family transcriptional regulator n=1 Tax=unclassified Actinoplanes TaxID=2626549 RepID=UPI0033A47768
MDLDLLAVFLDIYRTGSLSAAAGLRGVSQPAISGQLARLEREVGAPLFVRTHRGATPTERADDLARRAGPHLDALRRSLATGEPAPEPLGTIRIGGPAEGMTARILPALAPLVEGGLRVRASFGLAADLLTALARGELDLVVSAIRPTARGLLATPLIDEEFVLLGPPSLARTVDPAALATDPLRALAHLPLVAYAEDLPIIRRYWRSEFGRRPPNEVVLTAPDLRAVLAAVVAGAGVSVLPRFLAEAALSTGSVLELHRPEVDPLNTIFLAVAAGRRHDPTIAAVHGLLLDRARQWGSL